MSTQAENNKRIAKNTLLLYGRMLFTVGISFYSTRLILANLGVDNYGIYNVIGGFVSMFCMVSSTMTQAVGRFLTFELGTGDEKKLQQTFSTSINILLLLSLIVVVLAETIGLWFINYKLNINSDRMTAANWIYQFSVLSFILEMISVPYSASVISHEKMGTFAFITIAKVFLNLGIALLLSVSPIDKLIFYGILMFVVSASIQLMYWIYCSKNFPECRYSTHIDREIFKHMFGFAGWNFLTTCTAMLSSQGLNIMSNIYFGTFINAANGVASQINGTVGAFSKNFLTALNPQITKSYAANDIEYTRMLVCYGAKFSYILFFIIALPCIIEVDFLLSIWLKEVPQYSSLLVRLALLNSLVLLLSNTSETLNKATGYIKNYQIIVSIAQISIIVIFYILIKVTGSIVVVACVGNIVYMIIFIPCILTNKTFINISLSYFFNEVLKDILLLSFISANISIIPLYFLEMGFVRFSIVILLSTLSICIISYTRILKKEERNKLRMIILKRIGFIH